MSLQDKGPLQLFYERLYLVLTVTGVAAAAAWLLSGEMPRVYRSQARCYLPAQTDAIALTTEEGNLPTQPKLPTPVASMHQAMLGILSGPDLLQLVAASIEERDIASVKDSVDFAMDAFNAVVISAYDRDPEIARRMAAEYLVVFRDALDSSTRERVAENLASIDDEIADASELVTTLADQRLDLLEERGSIDIESEFRDLVDRVEGLAKQIDGLEVQIEVGERRTEELRALVDSRDEFEMSGFTEVENPRIASLQVELSRARIELGRLLQEYTIKHPEAASQQLLVELLEADLERERTEAPTVTGSRNWTQDSLRREWITTLADLDLNLVAQAAEREVLDRQYLEAREELLGIPRFRASLDDVEVELRDARDNLGNLRDRRNDMRFYLARRPSYLITKEMPVAATQPYLPRTSLNVLLAGALGMIVSVLIIVLRTRLASQRERALW